MVAAQVGTCLKPTAKRAGKGAYCTGFSGKYQKEDAKIEKIARVGGISGHPGAGREKIAEDQRNRRETRLSGRIHARAAGKTLVLACVYYWK